MSSRVLVLTRSPGVGTGDSGCSEREQVRTTSGPKRSHLADGKMGAQRAEGLARVSQPHQVDLKSPAYQAFTQSPLGDGVQACLVPPCHLQGTQKCFWLLAKWAPPGAGEAPRAAVLAKVTDSSQLSFPFPPPDPCLGAAQPRSGAGEARGPGGPGGPSVSEPRPCRGLLSLAHGSHFPGEEGDGVRSRWQARGLRMPALAGAAVCRKCFHGPGVATARPSVVFASCRPASSC